MENTIFNKLVSEHIVKAFVYNTIAHNGNVNEYDAYLRKANHVRTAVKMLQTHEISDWTYSCVEDCTYFYNRKLNVQISFHTGCVRQKESGYENPICVGAGMRGNRATHKIIRQYHLNLKNSISSNVTTFMGETKYDWIFQLLKK